ncbi:MAG TPA: biosynthetic peptidoglycan transglycosylase [Ktedonobacterales bacterium]
MWYSKGMDSVSTSPSPQGVPNPRRPRRGHGWLRALRSVTLAAVIAVALGALVGWLYLASLPSVADAPQRVAAILQAHRGQPVSATGKAGQAIVAVEDQRFYTNPGIDVVSMLHVTWGFITTGSTDQGGATIPEQLAKSLYVSDPTSVSGKLEEMGLAIKLDQRYSKAQILVMYLNAIYYGHDAYGIEQASQTYFHTSADQLTWGQASMLAGLPQTPSAYDPIEHFALARLRQRHVLSRLVATGRLTPAQATSAYAETAALP